MAAGRACGTVGGSEENGGRGGWGARGGAERESAPRWQTRDAALRQWHAGVIIQRHHLVPPPAGRRLSLGHTHTHTHTHSLSLRPSPRRIASPPLSLRRSPTHPAAPRIAAPSLFVPRQCPCPPLIAPPLAHRCPNPRARRAELRGAARTAHRLQVGPNDPHPARPLRVPDHYSNRASILACGPVAARCRLARARGGSGPPPMARRLPPRSAAAGKGGWGRVEW
jgi:hypothetical protein